MEPSKARALLLDQHEQLRKLFADAQRVAKRTLTGEPVTTELRQLITELRHRFAEHTATEERLLGPILVQDYAWGQARVDRMFEEHRQEHHEMRAALSGTDIEIATRIPELWEIVDAHMQAEERTFLAKTVLRDDIVTVEGGG